MPAVRHRSLWWRELLQGRERGLQSNERCDCPQLPDILADVRRGGLQIENQSHFREHCTAEALRRRRDELLFRLARLYRAQHGGALRSNLRKSGSTKPRHTFWISAAYSNGSAGSTSSLPPFLRTTPTSTSPSSCAGPTAWSCASNSRRVCLHITRESRYRLTRTGSPTSIVLKCPQLERRVLSVTLRVSVPALPS